MAPISSNKINVLTFILILCILLLGIPPLVKVIVFAKSMISWDVLGYVFGGLLLFTFILKKCFNLHIVSWISFVLWLFLTALMGVITYSLFSGSLSFQEMFSWEGRHSPGVLILPLTWLFMLRLTFGNITSKNKIKEEQSEIDDLYEKAFKQNNPNALRALATFFHEGKNFSFFKKSPVQAAKVFEGAQRLVQLIEEDHGKQLKLEDYYWLGLMYETGFACPLNPVKAIEYYNKALTTKESWDGNPENFHRLCKKVQQRLANLQKSN